MQVSAGKKDGFIFGTKNGRNVKIGLARVPSHPAKGKLSANERVLSGFCKLLIYRELRWKGVREFRKNDDFRGKRPRSVTQLTASDLVKSGKWRGRKPFSASLLAVFYFSGSRFWMKKGSFTVFPTSIFRISAAVFRLVF
ncbi:hypothetical protein C7120_00870 [Prevotella sp. oral taxon 376]|uniref:hypothetical protein n=1 Tax=Prevotella sp. oral taxon 376 TaxID=712466 RepID=UPI000D1F102A|nr:hypothetical protein [Prevotella sp. oral taxon 376]PTL33215.1 hypothetical protein C7120_00870 [Prevotella sp. oral taxon 376]